MDIPFIYLGSSVQIFPPGKPPITADESHRRWDEIKQAVCEGALEKAVKIIVESVQVKDIAKKHGFEFHQGHVTYRGRELSPYMSRRIIELYEAGVDLKCYERFVANLFRNPSRIAVCEFFQFMESARLPITSDGHFLAYKAVDPDYKDYHTRTIDNRVGTRHQMPRNMVDDNRHRACSYGFHAAAYTYARSFLQPGGHLVVVKINPADVVSVPLDHSCQKIRVSAYEVVDEIEIDSDELTDKPFANCDLHFENEVLEFDDDNDESAMMETC